MYIKIIHSLKNGTIFRKIKNKMIAYISKYILVPIIRIFCKPRNNQIMFLTFQGNYTCNPKAIADEFIKEKGNYRLVWVVRKFNLNHREQYPKELILVRRNTFRFYIEAARSKVIFDNSINYETLGAKKYPDQIFIETWHGSLGLKKMTADAIKDRHWTNKATKLGNYTDYCISNSTCIQIGK